MKSKWEDHVVEEVRGRGRKYTARFNNDVHQICEDLKKAEAEDPEKFVSEIVVIREEMPSS